MRKPSFDHLPTLFTRSAALEFGLTRHHLAGASSRQTLLTQGPGVYAVAAPWSQLAPQDRHSLLAAVAAAHDTDAVLSHVSAALAWGLPNPRGEIPAVWLTVIERPRTNRRESWVHLHRAELPSRHQRVLDGIRVTSPARTVVDCLRSLRRGDAVAIADAALRRGLTSLVEIEDAMDVEHRWPYLTRAHRGLPLVDPRRENWLESCSAVRLFDRGIPLATPQVSIYDLTGSFVARVDALWEELGIVGEADGAGKYLGDFEPDGDRSADAVGRRVMAAGVRESRLRDLGLGVVRWEPNEILNRPHDVAGRFEQVRARHDVGRVRALIRYEGSTAPPTLYSPGRLEPSWRAR